MSQMDEMVNRTLDLRGQGCPYVVFDTASALKALGNGQVLEVITDFYPAKHTIPSYCQDMGYPCEIHEAGKNLWRFIIRKTG